MTKPMKNRNDMFERLIRAARRIPEDPSSPYAFEKRIMAQIQSIRPVDAGTFWALGLWKATVPCLALMLCTTFWASLNGNADMGTSEELLASELQWTMAQPLQSLEETW